MLGLLVQDTAISWTKDRLFVLVGLQNLGVVVFLTVLQISEITILESSTLAIFMASFVKDIHD